MTDAELAQRLAASEAEAAALRQELEETSRGLMAVYAELTQQREELERARTAAEHASQAKAAFLANMSHEIRSPLNAVLGFTSLLLDTTLDAEQVDYAETIRAAGNHLRGVIDDILDLSKIDSGRLELERIPFDLVTCVEEAVGIVAPKAEEQGLALAALFPPDAPVTPVGDPVRLRQILVNLLSNAVKFTQRGEVSVEVVVEPVDAARCRLALRVRDTGIGIPADSVEKIFAPFTQADTSTTRNFGGTGLGLAICRELSTRMGGGITVTSTVGVGSTFTCTVEVGLAGPARLADPGDQPLSGRRILVRHEYPVVAESIARHLGTWGAELTTDPSIVDCAVLGTLDFAPDVPVVVAVPLAVRRTLPDSALAVSVPVRRTALRLAVLAALGQHQPGPKPGTPKPAPGRSLRILVAEDNLVNQRVAALMLERLGYRADLVADGQQAVAAMLAQDYDLVLMDLHMPRLDGLAAARQARERRPGNRPRIVAMTASATDESRRACLSGGMDDFLTKPVEPAELARVVADAARHGGKRRILYVDDNPMIIALVERILRREPELTLLTAGRGDTALELAGRYLPDLVFLDLHLPDMTGQDLLKHLRADPRTRTVPAIVVSGAISAEAAEELDQLGAAAILAKPFEPAQLRALVSSGAADAG
ncbi:MAG: response regulator [Actinobacteria bacterium]|nr:MAG: response regulator [Actinomycetota bacterium]